MCGLSEGEYKHSMHSVPITNAGIRDIIEYLRESISSFFPFSFPTLQSQLSHEKTEKGVTAARVPPLDA